MNVRKSFNIKLLLINSLNFFLFELIIFVSILMKYNIRVLFLLISIIILSILLNLIIYRLTLREIIFEKKNLIIKKNKKIEKLFEYTNLYIIYNGIEGFFELCPFTIEIIYSDIKYEKETFYIIAKEKDYLIIKSLFDKNKY